MLDFLKAHATDIGQGALILFGGLIAAVQLRSSGRRAPPVEETLAVAGDVVVIKSLDKLTAEMGALNVNLVAQRQAHEREATALEAMTAEAKEANTRLEAIEKELIGQRRPGGR